MANVTSCEDCTIHVLLQQRLPVFESIIDVIFFHSSYFVQCISRRVWWVFRMSLVQTWCFHNRRVLGTGKLIRHFYTTIIQIIPGICHLSINSYYM